MDSEPFPVFNALAPVEPHLATVMNGILSSNCTDPLLGENPIAYGGTGTLSW